MGSSREATLIRNLRARLERAQRLVDERNKVAASSGKYAEYHDKPVEFTRDILGIELVPLQQQVLRLTLVPPFKVLVPSANEQGKTCSSACLALWWFTTRSPAIVVTTAPKRDQVRNLLWKEIRKLAVRIPELPPSQIMRMERASDDFMIGVTARDSTSYQGHHGPNLLFIMDEGTGVAPGFWEATETMFSPPGHAWVVLLNPTTNASQAFIEFSRVDQARKVGDPLPWHVVRMSATDHPNIAAQLAGKPPVVPSAMRIEKFETLLRQWSTLVGADEFDPAGLHLNTDILWPPPEAKDYCARTGQKPRWWRPGPLAESRLLGRYARQGSNAVWSDGDWLAAVRDGWDAEKPTCKRLMWSRFDIPEFGVDLGYYGDDKTAIHTRIGPCSLGHEEFGKQSPLVTMDKLAALAEYTATWFNERIGCWPASERPNPITAKRIPIKIDATSDVTFVETFAARGYNAIPIKASWNAIEKANYPNRRSELWFSTAERARRDQLDFSRLSEEARDKLRRQAISVTYHIDSAGRRVVMSKDEMKALLGESPDGFDSLNLAYCPSETDAGGSFVVTKYESPTRPEGDRPGVGGRPGRRFDVG